MVAHVETTVEISDPVFAEAKRVSGLFDAARLAGPELHDACIAALCLHGGVKRKSPLGASPSNPSEPVPMKYHQPMREYRLLAFLLAWMVAAGLAPGLAADTVETVDGETLTGTIERGSFVLETEDGRRLEVPKESLREVHFESGRVHLELVEGRPLEGRLADEEIHLRLELYDRVLSAGEVRTIRFEPRTLAVAPGTEVAVQLLGPLDPYDPAADDVLLCVSEDFRVSDQVAVRRAAPAFGRVRLENDAGPAGIELTELVAIDGKTIRLRPRGRVPGAPARSVTGGAQELFPGPGLRLVAETAEEGDVSPVPEPPEGELLRQAAERCEATAAGTEPKPPAYVPVRWLARGRQYSGAPEPLRLQVVLDEVLEEGFQTVRLGDAPVDDTTFESMSLTLDEKRRGARLKLRTNLSVAPSWDRNVDLSYDLFAGKERIAGKEERRVEAEEEKRKTVRTKLTLSPKQLESLRGREPALLRITMTVEDD